MFSLKSSSFNRSKYNFHVLITFYLLVVLLTLNADDSKEKALEAIQQEINQKLSRCVDSKKIEELKKEAASLYFKKGQVVTVQTRFGTVTGKYNGWYGDKIIIGNKSIYKFDVPLAMRKKFETSQSGSDETYNKLVDTEFRKLKRKYFSEIKKRHYTNIEKQVYNKHGYLWNPKTKEWINQANAKKEIAEALLAIENMKSPHETYVKIRNIPYNYPSVRKMKGAKEKFFKVRELALKEAEKEITDAVSKARKTNRYSIAISALSKVVKKYDYAPSTQIAIKELNTYVLIYNKRKVAKQKATDDWKKYTSKFAHCPYCSAFKRLGYRRVKAPSRVCPYCHGDEVVIIHGKSKDFLGRTRWNVSSVNMKKYPDRFIDPDKKEGKNNEQK